MKNKFIRNILILALGVLTAQIALAQGTLYVSNVGETPTGSAAVASDSWIAQSIITGTNSGGYALDSIQLLMDAASGSSGGFAVSVYSSLGGQPYNNLGSLAGSDPSDGGLFTYTAAGMELSPSTFYFVVVTAATPVAQGAYVWSGANTPPYVGNQQWTVYDFYESSSDGSSWTGHTRQDVFQMAIYATAAPEPGVLGLFALGGLLVALQRRKTRPVQ
jgi:hypothetical protein